MHVLVTGGAGFIGSHVVDALPEDAPARPMSGYGQGKLAPEGLRLTYESGAVTAGPLVTPPVGR